MAVLICPICGTRKEYSKGLQTYCSRSCSNKGTPKHIKPRIDHAEIIRLAKLDTSRADIAEVVGCSISTVNRVLRVKK